MEKKTKYLYQIRYNDGTNECIAWNEGIDKDEARREFFTTHTEGIKILSIENVRSI